MAREDLNPVEEARACAALVEELGLTREDVGRRVGRSRVAVSNLIRLLDLPDEALEPARARATSARATAARCCSRGPRRAPAAGARRRRRRAGRCASWSAARARRTSRAASRAPTASRSALHPDQQAAVEQIADALRHGARHGGHASRPQRRRLPRSSSPSTRSTTRSSWLGASARRRRPEAAARRADGHADTPRRIPLESALAGRLAQSVRALL